MAATLAAFKVPSIDNEPTVSWLMCAIRKSRSTEAGTQRSYLPGSDERKGLEAAITAMKQNMPFEVPCVVNGKEVRP